MSYNKQNSKNKIIFISYGDSTIASSWSNIPYLFSENLEKKGFELVRTDINPSPKCTLLWNRYASRFIAIFYTDHAFSFIRTWFFRKMIFTRIKQVVEANKDAYFCIILNFDFYNKFNETPTLLFGDWTYDILIKEHFGREPYFFEKWFVKYQRKAIKESEIVVSLFKNYSKHISTFNKKNVQHLGINVINDLNLNPFSSEEILKKKVKSTKILFIGSSKYLEGAKKLVQAFKIIKLKHSKFHLNLIGISEEELFSEGELTDIHCYGYLRKEIADQNKLYYELLTEAKVLVNPSEVWAAYSSTVEAMKYFTPVIIKPYKAFTDDFGVQNTFGFYLESTGINDIVEAIDQLLVTKSYIQWCKNANYLVKDYTWENYVEKLLVIMDNHKKINGRNLR